jgi:hypothetical protein
MGHRFTGANSKLNITHQRPSRVALTDESVVSAFIGWTTEAIEQQPLNDDAKVVVDALIAGHHKDYDYVAFSVLRLSGFLLWVEQASEYCAPSEVAGKVVTAFTDFRDQLDRYQSQIRNYWFQ